MLLIFALVGTFVLPIVELVIEVRRNRRKEREADAKLD